MKKLIILTCLLVASFSMFACCEKLLEERSKDVKEAEQRKKEMKKHGDALTKKLEKKLVEGWDREKWERERSLDVGKAIPAKDVIERLLREKSEDVGETAKDDSHHNMLLLF